MTLCFLCPHPPLGSSLLLSISSFSSLCDMWSFHFIPVWLSRALKYCSSLSIISCSIAGSLCSSAPSPRSWNTFLQISSLYLCGQSLQHFLYYFTRILLYVSAISMALHTHPHTHKHTHTGRECTAECRWLRFTLIMVECISIKTHYCSL